MAELVYPPVILTARAMFRLLGLRFVEEHLDRIPRSGGAVLASNHVSYLDFIFVGLAARPSGRLVRFMAKREVFESKVAGPLMRGMRHIPVDRSAGAASYAEALAALRRGEIVGVFPEATISRSFQIKGLKSGAARLATEAGVPLIPMVTWGGQRMMTKGRPKNFRRRGVTITMSVGDPMHPQPDADVDAVTADLSARLSALLAHVQQDYPDQPAPGEDPWWLPAAMGGSAPSPEEAAGLDAAGK